MENEKKPTSFYATKEFYDLMDMFERDLLNNSLNLTYSKQLKREPKELWKTKYFYANAEVNTAFKAYILGYTYGKTVNRND